MSRPSRVAHVHPTEDDRVVAALSEVVGGPVGPRAGRARWWTPVRVLLALTALCFALGLVSKTSCAAAEFDSGAKGDARLCTSPVAAAFVDTGLVELAWPWSDDEETRDRYPVADQPALVGLWSYAAARVTHVLAGSPALGPRYRASASSLGVIDDGVHEDLDRQVNRERRLFVAVNAVGLALLALLAVAALSAVNRRRPWDAAVFAAAPVLALTSVVSWDLISAAAAAGALLAWSRRRPVLAGVLVGLGAAAGVWPVLLLPAFLLVAARRDRTADVLPAAVTAAAVWALANAPAFLSGRSQWQDYWDHAVSRAPDRGSLWTVLDGVIGVAPSTVTTWSWSLLGLWAAGVIALALAAPVVPRVAQVGFLLVAGALLLSVTYQPGQALWLLPLSALARPRWRDQIVWQSGEVFFFAMEWWHRGGFLDPGVGGDAGFYWIAIGVRIVCTLWLVGMVVRDVWWADHDPVVGERQVTTMRSNVVAV